MPDRAQLPPPDRLIPELRTADHTFQYFREIVARDSPRFMELNPIPRGTPYAVGKGADPQIVRDFPALFFVRQTVPIGSNTVAGMTQSELVCWEWTTTPDAESVENAEISYLGDAVANPAYARISTVRRSVYEANPTLTPGSATLTGLIGIKVTNGGSGYTSAPTVAIAGGLGATAEAVINAAGVVSHVVVTKESSGYDSASLPAITFSGGGGTGAAATAIVQPKTAVLTSQKKVEFPADSPYQAEFVQVLRTFEILPGPYLPFTRWSEDLGPIQGRRRAVLNTGQITTLGATSKKTYEARDGSSIVSWEIEENWSDGTGSAGNPAYPIGITDFYDNERGAVHQTSQIVADTNSTGSLAVAGGVATQIRYEKFGDNPFLRKKIVETWAVPGPVVRDNPRYDGDLGKITSTRRLVENTSQALVESATGRTRYEPSKYGAILIWEITESWSATFPIKSSTEFEKDGVRKVVTRQLMAVGSVVTTETLVADVLTRKFGEKYSEFLAFQVIETITVIDADLLDLPSFTTSIENLIPIIFRGSIPTHVESHIVEGFASQPGLLTGEFEHSERQLTPLYMEVRSTMLDSIGSLPITISGIKETNERKQVVSVAMKLCVDSTTPTTPTALIDVDFKKLGNGLAIEITKTIPSVFAATSSTVEIPDLIPPEFRASFPLTTTDVSSAGTAANPAVLSTGDIRKTEAQIDAFVKRVTTASRGSISFPATLTLHETTTEFGGGDLEITVTIDDSLLTIDEGLLVVSSEAKPLGGGLYLKITKALDDTEWPELEGTKVDENLRITIPFTKQIVGAGATGGVVGDVQTEVNPLDKWRSITIASTIPDDLSELDVTYPTTRNHIFPDTITDAELVEVWASASNSTNEDFAYEALVKYKLKSGYRGPCDGQIIETYTTTPSTDSYPVTKFFPEEFLGYTTFYYEFAADPGSVHAVARIFTHRLPSSLHDEIDLTPAGVGADGLIVPATDPIALPTTGTLITVDRNTERWRFGIWRNQVTQIYVP